MVEGFDVHEVGSTSKVQRPAHSPQVFRLLVKDEASYTHPAQPGVGGVTRQADLVLASSGNVEVAQPSQLKVMPAASERSQSIAASHVPASSTMNVRNLEVEGPDVGLIDWVHSRIAESAKYLVVSVLVVHRNAQSIAAIPGVVRLVVLVVNTAARGPPCNIHSVVWIAMGPTAAHGAPEISFASAQFLYRFVTWP